MLLRAGQDEIATAAATLAKAMADQMDSHLELLAGAFNTEKVTGFNDLLKDVDSKHANSPGDDPEQLLGERREELRMMMKVVHYSLQCDFLFVVWVLM